MDEEIRKLLAEWQTLKTELQQHHRNREGKQVIELMKKGIELFRQFLFYCNDFSGSASPNQEVSLSLVKNKPVNGEERLDFITAKPGLFHSFVQLSELMMEQEKIYQKKQAIEKGLSRKSK